LLVSAVDVAILCSVEYFYIHCLCFCVPSSGTLYLVLYWNVVGHVMIRNVVRMLGDVIVMDMWLFFDD